MKQIFIKNKRISSADRPFIIAEMSGNHNQSLERALNLVEAAAASGADAVKIQTYTADTMTLDCDSEYFRINDKQSLWYGRNLYDLYNEAHTPWEWHKPIFDKCEELGIICFSSPFDFTAVDFLETLDVPCYKIASFEITHLPLIEKVASTKKPLILSTGMSSLKEISEAVSTAQKAGAEDIIILKCTSAYPALAKDANLNTIIDMQNQFPDCVIGLSDHTMGLGVPIAATALGARVIEKHFTLKRSDGGVDSAFSLEPDELKLLVQESEKAYDAIGKVNYAPSEREKNSLQFRQSIWINRDIKKGEKISEENIKICRPGFSLSPKHYDDIINKVANRDLKKGDILIESVLS